MDGRLWSRAHEDRYGQEEGLTDGWMDGANDG